MERAHSPKNLTIRLDSVRSIGPSKWIRWAVGIGALVAACVGWPCSGVGPPGVPVVFGDQTNIVIWDEENQVEHFIRNANFRAGANDFGFIAPTPGKPEICEASTQAFYTLANLGPAMGFGRGGGFGGGGLGGVSMSSQVKVIQEADVAGYRATTLWSRSARAINDWMNEHGYVSTPEVEKWATRYCQRGWYLTAFKVMDRAKAAASTGTIRMTFKTDKPFNPFYVPSTNIPGSGKGTLRVYFVSVGDYDAHIGYTSQVWQTPQWTAAVPEATADLLAKQVKLPAGAVPEKAQVETFVDPNFPRPAPEDIYFRKRKPVEVPAESASPPAQTIPPSAAPALLAGLALLTVAQRRRTPG